MVSGGIGPRRPDQAYNAPSGWPAQSPRTSQASVPIPSDLLLTSDTGASIAASSTLAVRELRINRPSYLITIDAECVSSPATPFYSVAFQWKDPVSSTLLAYDKWFLMATNVSPASGNALIAGRGPAKAARLDIVIENYDASNAISVDYALYQSSRSITRDDLRSVSNNITGNYTFGGLTYTTPVSEPAALVLGNSPGITIPASSDAARIHGLFCGQTQLYVTVTGTSPSASLVLHAVDPGWATPLQQIYQADVTAEGTFTPFITTPRMPTVLHFINHSATNSLTVDYSHIAQEFSS